MEYPILQVKDCESASRMWICLLDWSHGSCNRHSDVMVMEAVLMHIHMKVRPRRRYLNHFDILADI